MPKNTPVYTETLTTKISTDMKKDIERAGLVVGLAQSSFIRFIIQRAVQQILYENNQRISLSDYQHCGSL